MKKARKEAIPGGFPYFFMDGPDGSRTRVRKQIPFPSTIIVRFCDSPPQKDAHVLLRPVSPDTPMSEGKRPCRFSHK